MSMSSFLCLLLFAATPVDELAPGEEIEEEVDFEEEEAVDFGEEEPVTRVSLPEVEHRPWLVAFLVVMILLLAWNVAWRRPARKPPPRSAAP